MIFYAAELSCTSFSTFPNFWTNEFPFHWIFINSNFHLHEFDITIETQNFYSSEQTLGQNITNFFFNLPIKNCEEICDWLILKFEQCFGQMIFRTKKMYQMKIRRFKHTTKFCANKVSVKWKFIYLEIRKSGNFDKY